MNKSDFCELLNAAGPSGYETNALSVWISMAGQFADECYIDEFGNGVAIIKAETPNLLSGDVINKHTVILDSHIDEIGLQVNHIDDEGIIHVGAIGSYDPAILVGQRVKIYSRKSDEFICYGVIGRLPTHLQSEDNEKTKIKIENIFIDIGSSTFDITSNLISIGDYVTIDREMEELSLFNIFTGKAIDNRAGCFAILETLERHAKLSNRKTTLIGIASVREETYSTSGARFYDSWKADDIITIDVTHASDQPNFEVNEQGERLMGSGPSIAVGSFLSKSLISELEYTAEHNNIDYTIEACPAGTGTNAEHTLLGNSNACRVGVISIPIKYMHTPVEMVNFDDIVNTAILLSKLYE